MHGGPSLFLPVLALAPLLVGLSACRSPDVYVDRAVTEVDWLDDGFRLHSPSRTFVYRNRGGAETGTLTYLDEYRKRFEYVDRGLNESVDEIRLDARGIGDQKVFRGAEGTEELFARADAFFKEHSEELQVRDFVEKWKGGGRGGFAEFEAMGGE